MHNYRKELTNRMNVLSIQSHVVFGHVGNSVAVFPLQRLGHDVWPINTVTYSNHPGYGKFEGNIIHPGQFTELINGLDGLGIFSRCDAVITGYLGDSSVARAVGEFVKGLKSRDPGALFCCDPVMGNDSGGFFVPEDLCVEFREHLVCGANVITPNQFEFEYLFGRSLCTLDDIIEASNEMHHWGPELIIVTSLSVQQIPKGMIGTLATTKNGAWLVLTPRLSGKLFGAGDLFAALFLGHYLKARSLEESLAKAVSATYGILLATEKSGASELEVIKAQQQIISPTSFFSADKIA